ncbi:IS110 family transposase [Rubellimicrobium roseum]|uniref:IS110 family transposase n=1 Tax=Rubellimicrobium roseum TaxID=687525 RepID=A0A5C4N663_9RHOB|nr:IS110 family transposase [Rubellimicrobium roseum]
MSGTAGRRVRRGSGTSAPDLRSGRDFAAWLGLTPWPHSTGGRRCSGATMRMGERSLRRLLIPGANDVVVKRPVHAAAAAGRSGQQGAAGRHRSEPAANGPDRVGTVEG